MKCFVAGTMIATATGLIAIENIKAGDKVLSTSEESLEVAEKNVVETYIRETREILHLTINGEIISTTYEHPFYVKDRGFIEAGELEVGEELLDTRGNIVYVEQIHTEILEEPVKVYNFQVEEYHTYHVGETGILVHNADYNGANGDTRKYAPNDGKHKNSAKGDVSADPFYKDIKAGEKSLKSAYSSDSTKQLYNVHDGKVVKFQPDNIGGYHPYEVINPSMEVPTDVLRQMKADGTITKTQYKKWIKNK